MCRLLAYKGSSVILDKLLYQPEYSLIKKSYNAKEMEESLNDDGFGIGWYVDELGEEPGHQRLNEIPHGYHRFSTRHWYTTLNIVIQPD